MSPFSRKKCTVEKRQLINQSLVGTNELPIESIPTLFSFTDTVSRLLTGFVFYWLTPLVLVTITWKAWALSEKGLPLTYVSGVVTVALVFLQIRRRPDNQRQWWTPLYYTILILIIGLPVRATFKPQSFHRPLNLFRAELSKAWLVGIDMSSALAHWANLQETNLRRAHLRRAHLEGANLQQADLQQADLAGAQLQQADLQAAILSWANLQRANLWQANLQRVILPPADLRWADLRRAQLQ